MACALKKFSVVPKLEHLPWKDPSEQLAHNGLTKKKKKIKQKQKNSKILRNSQVAFTHLLHSSSNSQTVRTAHRPGSTAEETGGGKWKVPGLFIFSFLTLEFQN